jgi:hypothetical protein
MKPPAPTAHCAWVAKPKDPAAYADPANQPVDPCKALTNVTCSTLPNECIWYDPNDPPRQLFGKEFCQPLGDL